MLNSKVKEFSEEVKCEGCGRWANARLMNLTMNAILCGYCEEEIDRDMSNIPVRLNTRLRKIVTRTENEFIRP